jgi:hypothetical protein
MTFDEWTNWFFTWPCIAVFFGTLIAARIYLDRHHDQDDE